IVLCYVEACFGTLNDFELPGFWLCCCNSDDPDLILYSRFRLDADVQCAVVEGNLVKQNTCSRVKVARLHRPDNRRWRKRVGVHHNPPSSGVCVCCSKLVIVMTVVRGQSVHQGLVTVAVCDIDQIPHGFRSGPQRISVVVYQRMAVVNFKETLPAQFNHITERNAIVKVWMVHVREHGHACLLPLAQHSIDVSLQYFQYTSSTLRRNPLLYIGGIDMNGSAVITVGKFL